MNFNGNLWNEGHKTTEENVVKLLGTWILMSVAHYYDSKDLFSLSKSQFPCLKIE
jgi:hypothetical protein